MPWDELDFLEAVTVSEQPVKLSQECHYIIGFPVQVSSRSGAEEEGAPRCIVHFGAFHRTTPLDVFHVLERDEDVDVRRDNRVVDVLNDTRHGKYPVITRDDF